MLWFPLYCFSIEIVWAILEDLKKMLEVSIVINLVMIINFVLRQDDWVVVDIYFILSPSSLCLADDKKVL